MHDPYHINLGKPLNRPEIAVLILYTHRSKLCAAFRWSQMQGDFAKWTLLDRYLMDAICKLHRAETKKKRDLYSGLHNVYFDTKVKFGFLATHTSTSSDEQQADHFMKNKDGIKKAC